MRAPTLAQKARNLASAAATVAVAAVAHQGPILVSAEVEARRRAACAACDLWHPEGNAGLGECRHPSCGCTGLKHKLAAMSCPLDPPAWREEVGHA